LDLNNYSDARWKLKPETLRLKILFHYIPRCRCPSWCLLRLKRM
jgi:hypothetical protein